VAFLPAQRVAKAFVRLDDQINAVAHLQVALDGAYTRFPGRFLLNSLANLSARWRRQLAEPTTVEGGLLLSAVYVVPDGAAATHTFVPGAEVTYKTRLMQGTHLLEYDASVRAAPFLDRFLAAAYYRAELVGSLNYVFQGVWHASARLLLGRGLNRVIVQENQPFEVVSVFFEGRVGYVSPKYWRLEVSGVDSIFVLGNSAPFNNWLVSLSFTVTAGGNF
jgi:hypothetical protein